MKHKHALLLGSDGNVYSVGSNEYGQLGLGHRNRAPNFNKIHQFDSIEVLKVQVSYDSSAILTKSGEVYTFGWWNKTIHPERFEGLTHVLGFSIKYNIKLFLALKKKS